MKLMIASDIHGSSYYCRKMIDAYALGRPAFAKNRLLPRPDGQPAPGTGSEPPLENGKNPP